MTTITNTTAIVTPAQIALCERVVDATTGQAFYIVKSEHYDENYTEYTVKAIKIAGRYWTTCTCPAGLKGVACKHKIWAAAAAQVHKTQAKVEAMTSTPVATNVDSATLAVLCQEGLPN